MSATVCCVLLVNGREAMVRRAIASWRAQTYKHKRLLIWDSSPGLTHDHEDEQERIFHMPAPLPIAATIGALRNEANRFACLAGDEGELIAHWDSDDWSHPRRLEEQVALLEASGKQCVGYRELLFWDTRDVHERPNQAWIYRNHQQNWAAGASLLYRRELWESQPFDDAPHEDQRWMMTPAVSGQCLSVVGLGKGIDPRMVCRIHGSNSEAYDRKIMQSAPEWRRTPEFDEYCERTMAL